MLAQLNINNFGYLRMIIVIMNSSVRPPDCGPMRMHGVRECLHLMVRGRVCAHELRNCKHPIRSYFDVHNGIVSVVGQTEPTRSGRTENKHRS